MVLEKTRYKVKVFWNGLWGKSPTFHIKENDIEVRFHNLSDYKNLPFDLDTYETTQLFIGNNYSNPWNPDIDSIEKMYNEYSYDDPINDLIKKKHIIPSQRYKLLMNQDSLTDTFRPSSDNLSRMQTLLYVAIAGIGFLVLLRVT